MFWKSVVPIIIYAHCILNHDGYFNHSPPRSIWKRGGIIEKKYSLCCFTSPRRFAVPQILSDFGTNLTTEIFIMAMFAMSLGLIMGYAGFDSLGHAAFFGIGAYFLH